MGWLDELKQAGWLGTMPGHPPEGDQGFDPLKELGKYMVDKGWLGTMPKPAPQTAPLTPPAGPGQMAPPGSPSIKPGDSVPWRPGMPQQNPLMSQFSQLLGMTQDASFTLQSPNGPIIKINAKRPTPKKGQPSGQMPPQVRVQQQPQGVPPQGAPSPQGLPQQGGPIQPPSPSQVPYSSIYQKDYMGYDPQRMYEEEKKLIEQANPDPVKAYQAAQQQYAQTTPRWKRIAYAIMAQNPFIGDQIASTMASQNMTRSQAMSTQLLAALDRAHQRENDQNTKNIKGLEMMLNSKPDLQYNKDFARDLGLSMGIPSSQIGKFLENSYDSKTGAYSFAMDEGTRRINTITSQAEAIGKLYPWMNKDQKLLSVMYPDAFGREMVDPKKQLLLKMQATDNPVEKTKLAQQIEDYDYMNRPDKLTQALRERLEALEASRSDMVTGSKATKETKSMWNRRWAATYMNFYGEKTDKEGSGLDSLKAEKLYYQVAEAKERLRKDLEARRREGIYGPSARERVMTYGHPEMKAGGKKLDPTTVVEYGDTYDSIVSKVDHPVQGKAPALSKEEAKEVPNFIRGVEAEINALDPVVMATVRSIDLPEAVAIYKELRRTDLNYEFDGATVANEIIKHRHQR